jgi:hypothetical protein
LEDGSIACVLLSNPGIAPPSSWFLHKGGARNVLPSEVAHYEDVERRRTQRTSFIIDDGGGGGGDLGGGDGRGEKYQPQIMVPRILRGAIDIVDAAVQNSANAEVTTGLADSPDVLEPQRRS